MNDQAFMNAIKEFEASHSVSEAAIAALDICAIYKKVKPILTGLLPFIKLIPVIGAPAGAAITALMAVLDGVCAGK